MKTRFAILFVAFALIVLPVFNSLADEALGVAEFRKLYDGLLAGKTLVTESDENGAAVRKERHYGKAVDLGDGDFEIPVEQVITYTRDGKIDMEITIDVVDIVNDLGGSAVIEEEIRGLAVLEAGDEKPEEARGVEFGGIYRVGKNDKGGFDVNNFGLIPSLKVGDDSLTLAGSMISYSCYPEKGKTVCALSIRDFDLGEYERFKGYEIGEPIGDDFSERWEEVTAAE